MCASSPHFCIVLRETAEVVPFYSAKGRVMPDVVADSPRLEGACAQIPRCAYQLRGNAAHERTIISAQGNEKKCNRGT